MGMEVFIGNLPANGSLIELDEIMGGVALHSRFERRLGRDCFAKNYHYFVVFTDSDEEGWKLIERLNGKVFNGTRITAREFIQRSDSRLPAADWDREERRINPVTSE
jgi:hypothetical protein